VLDVVRREPRQFGLDRTRWTLATLRQGCPWLAEHSRSGVWRVLDALGVALKRGRFALHSPDPDYAAKRERAAACVAAARASGGRVVALYEDEADLFRQPTLAAAYAARGRDQARVGRGLRADAATRLAATLDPGDGRVVATHRAAFDVAALLEFYRQVVAAYPGAARLYVIQDNWPVHFHPDLLVALEPQECPWPWPRPANWPTEPSAAARRRWGGWRLPIQLVPLPTYASWLNPAEKLWRWLRQEVVHHHPWADDPPALQQAALRFLARFATGSPDLLRYAGLQTHD
jgi:hypothetical protein